MFLSDISIKRPVMISMVMIALLLFGIIGYLKMPLNLMPDAKIPYVSVQTIFAGAAPEQIENLITKKIEDEISSISQLKSISSYSLNSASIIILEFNLDKNPDIAFQDTKEKVDAILNELPADANAPVISKVDIAASPVMNLLLSGEIESTELNFLAETSIKDRLSQIDGVGNVDVIGGTDREIRVEFDRATVFENHLNLSQVAGILSYANMDMPGGNFQEQDQDYSVSLKGNISSTDELEAMMIPTATGMRRLGQLALIEPASEDVRERITYFDNTTGLHQDNAVLLSIIKSPEGNPVELADQVKKILPEIRAQLPESVNLTITMDESGNIQDTVNDTLGNILLGVILTAGILLFFLHDFRSTLIVALTMPLSIIPTFIIMNQLGITLNLMSLMGLSTSVGVLVMNSVVVLENIFRHKGMGNDRKTAAAKGTGEVVVAVFASTMTNVCVFLPLGTMGGIAGVFIGDFAWTVVIATLFSLLVSFTLTPMLASLLLPETPKPKNRVSKSIEMFFKSLEKGYAFVLEKILHNRLRSSLLIGGTLILFILAMVAFTLIPFEFMPTMDSGSIGIEIELKEDASLEQTAALIRQVEDRIAGFDEVDRIVTTLGKLSSMDRGTNMARIAVQLIDKSGRDSHSVIAGRMNVALSDISGAVIRITAESGMSSGDAPVSFYLQGSDMDQLKNTAQKMQAAMTEISGVTGIDSSVKEGKPEIVLYPDRQALSDMGLTLQELAVTMRGSIDGLVMTQLKTGNREYDIRVTLADSEISSYEDIRQIPVATRFGMYPLSYFAEVEIEDGVSKLLRIDKQNTVNITSSMMSGYALGTITSAIDEVSEEILPSGIELKWGGDADMMNETMRNMAFAFILAVILTYMLLAAMLEKIGQPLLILTTIPLSLIGVVALFLLGGISMNMASMIAIVMLVGMVVNNAILILEYTNQLRAGGKDVRSALLEACPTKLQPILMANIATILGMLPMALGIGSSGVEMRQPMGLVSIGGILASTFLTLFVIPAVENTLVSGKAQKKANAKGDITL